MTKIKTTELTRAERIDRAREGRTQSYTVTHLNKQGIEITEVEFSRMKNGLQDFPENVLKALSEFYGTEITN